ncbi:tyrosine-type recombinase/integrase [Thalassoroseus pseudoceratinae]|uniref:tyrosine-type recombinase/integrase n=1 Tax=Thalassoroseus pseudoceratinae TaxID=2713176 RepID=UPI0014207B53|nr:site-specific integrase [Thalassoroseus pseudoceratinae]
MSRKPKPTNIVRCRYFEWRIYQRDGIYQADGRRRNQSLARYSLGVENYDDALAVLEELDLTQAIRHGLANEDDRRRRQSKQLLLAEGRSLYETHLNRPQAAGGVRKKTKGRYKAILDKFFVFCEEQKVSSWNGVNATLLQTYLAHLEEGGYAQATVYIEGNTIKQIVKFLIEQKQLPPECQVNLSLSKQRGTTTYCYTKGEVAAIIRWCEQDESLHWLRNIVIALVTTGLRISELASLRWSDLSNDLSMIELTDESGRRSEDRRTTKTGRDRTFPIHADLKAVLEAMPRSGREIFKGPRGGKLKPDTVLNILKRDVLRPLAKRLSNGVTPRIDEGGVHSFRHYFCSVSASSGVPEQIVMRWLGHSSSEMVQRYYHLHDEEAKRQMSRLNFIEISGGRSAGTND